MATSAQRLDLVSTPRLGVLRVAATTALTASAFLLLCWLGARIGLAMVPHMYIQLFSGASIASFAALWIGLCWSIGGGLIAGGLFAAFYNWLSPLQ